MPYSTGCSTALSNFEAGQNYKDVSGACPSACWRRWAAGRPTLPDSWSRKVEAARLAAAAQPLVYARPARPHGAHAARAGAAPLPPCHHTSPHPFTPAATPRRYRAGFPGLLKRFTACLPPRPADPAVIVSFPLDGDEDGASLVAWTTTPWTLPSNLALCVHADFDYVKTRDPGEDGQPAAGDHLQKGPAPQARAESRGQRVLRVADQREAALPPRAGRGPLYTPGGQPLAKGLPRWQLGLACTSTAPGLSALQLRPPPCSLRQGVHCA